MIGDKNGVLADRSHRSITKAKHEEVHCSTDGDDAISDRSGNEFKYRKYC